VLSLAAVLQFLVQENNQPLNNAASAIPLLVASDNYGSIPVSIERIGFCMLLVLAE